MESGDPMHKLARTLAHAPAKHSSGFKPYPALYPSTLNPSPVSAACHNASFNRHDVMTSVTDVNFSLAVRVDDTWKARDPHSASTQRTPTLTPQSIKPERLNKCASAMDRVAKIRWIEVVAAEHKTGEKHSFAVRISLDQRPGCLRSPTFLSPPRRSLQSSRPDAIEPTHRVCTRYEEFQTLRHELLELVQQPHEQFCRLCEHLQTMLTFSSTRPAMAVWALLPTATKCHVLAKLLRELVGQYQAHRSLVNRRCACYAERQITRLLAEFLFVDER